MRRVVAALAFFLASAAAHAQGLTIVKAGPVGEVAQLAEANEIRVVFSEPMVVVGKIPKDVTPPWFHIAPAVDSTFRWSGTTTLIFTPKEPLPYATKFDVAIDASAKSVAGHTLGKPYSFSFVTPTIKLMRTAFYRKGDKANGAVVIGLWFNQPVERDVIAQHLQLRTVAHEIKLPELQPEAIARLQKNEPQAMAAFNAKVEKAKQAAASNGQTILSFLTDDWDRSRWPAAPELIVLETKPGISTDTNLQVYLDSALASGPARVATGSAQTYDIQLPPAFFVNGLECTAKCNPESANFIEFRIGDGVGLKSLSAALSVIDITDAAHESVLKPHEVSAELYDRSRSYSLDDLGYTLEPAHAYAVRVDPKLDALDGQLLGYTYVGIAEYWHKSAFTSFGGGHGVWESSGGPVLPFFARNYQSVTQWAAPVSIADAMPTILKLQEHDFTDVPPTPPQPRKLAPVPDKIQSYGMNVAPIVSSGKGSDNKGLVWAAVEAGEPIPKAQPWNGEPKRRATLIQITNLGISVKDSPLNTLIFVTRLDNGAPVAGANVSIRKTDNKVFWTGTTDAHGIATAPNTHLRLPEKTEEKKAGDEEEYEGEDSWSAASKLSFIVTAEKDGDAAYVASNWNNGLLPWEFDVAFDLSERVALLRGTIFTDRGVYKLGEEVHFKAVIRSDTPRGMQLLSAGTKLDIAVRDSHDKEVDKRTVVLSEWSSAEWTWSVPAEGPLGNYTVIASAQSQKLAISGDFLVAAYRRPDFRVDATLTAPTTVAGVALDGRITARYLFGAAMSKRPVRTKYTKVRLFDVPPKVRDRFPDNLYTFLGCFTDCYAPKIDIDSKELKLDTKGELKQKLPTELAAGLPYSYQYEGEVTDVSRQKIANRASFRVDPAPWYIGVKNAPYFADTVKGLDTEIIAAGLDGIAVPGVKVDVKLERVQWNSVRHAEGHGFYTWESERKEVPSGDFSVTTQSTAVPLHVPLKDGGEYHLTATATDAAGHTTSTLLWFYATGAGYTAWERYDHNRIDLVPEKKTYRPGETARIMIKSPWEKATALLTTEREGVRTSKEFDVTSTQQTITVPISEGDIPNVYVSVLLVKGRTKDAVPDDASDPGKPSFRLGYTELLVEDAAKRLTVDVKANRDEYRPATKARIDVNVKDAKGGTRAEVTLWAVDYGVLSLTGYKTPDVLQSIYLHKSLQVLNEDSRQMIIARRALTPKGANDGGGGGRDAGPGMLRKDFRVLAFWLGSITTDAKGRAHTEVTLPESLTTYRIMAVAADKSSRFGRGDAEIRINKPVLLTQAFPRFLAVGDKAYFGAVVHSQLAQAGKATVTIKSLDPAIIELTGETKKVLDVAAKGTAEVRFDAVAKAVGEARIQMSVSLNGEADAFEDVVPVRVLVSPETVAAYGEARPTAKETLEIPGAVVPGFGGLHVDLASTAMVGLAEGAEYLVTYPYGCAEQRGSAAFALMLASDLGDAFKLPGIDPPKARNIAQSTLVELEKYQCSDGGFAYWAGECAGESPYLTANLLHLFQRGQKLKYNVNAGMVDRAYTYLDKALASQRPTNESWWPAYTAWQAFAVKVLVEGGRNEDSHITRLSTYADRMPIFALSYLADALIAKGEGGPRLAELTRRINNAILPEGGSAHVEELADPYLLYFWNSSVRSTAIALDTLVRQGGEEQLVKQMVRWLMKIRVDGRWSNTQENAWAMEALVDYYRKYEAEVPDFTAIVTVGSEQFARDTFKGRSAEAKAHDWSMPQLLAKAAAGTQMPVLFERQGTGTLFYLMRLRYASSEVMHDPLDKGFAVDRKYTTPDGTKPLTTFKAGEMIKVTLRIRNTKERRFVAVTDPIPAGTEPVETMFATTASDIAEQQTRAEAQQYDWMAWWRGGGFDHVERHDDRVDLFATRLSEGDHTFTYMLRATTAGTFITAPAHAEEMYEPEVFGRTASAVVEVSR
jgi:uncharacterized protein YfaS (alpha-2-macroglobulin family)